MENFSLPYYTLDDFDYNLIDVKSIDETSAQILNSGGYTLVPKHVVPGRGYLAMFKNAEGTMFGVWQRDVTAH